MNGKPALRRSNALGQALQGAGGERKKSMSHAWWRARFGRAIRKSERAEARPLYAQSHRTAPGNETNAEGDQATYQGLEVRETRRRQIRDELNGASAAMGAAQYPRRCHRYYSGKLTNSSWSVDSLAVRRGRRRSRRGIRRPQIPRRDARRCHLASSSMFPFRQVRRVGSWPRPPRTLEPNPEHATEEALEPLGFDG